MINIDTYHNLIRIKNKEQGELALVKENGTIYKYENGHWNKQEISANKEASQKLTLYGLNKIIIPQLPSLTEEQLAHKQKDIISFIMKCLKNTGGKYFLLLSRNIGYYTLFNTQHSLAENSIADEIYECLKTIGEIKSIEPTEDNSAIEIWVVDSNNNAEPFYLIDWTEGTIECSI